MEKTVRTPSMWFVTGSSGFLGSEVSFLLHNLNFEVIGIDNMEPEFEPKWKTVKSDFGKFSEHLSSLADQSFGVIHCAALKTVLESEMKKDEFVSNNFDKSKLLFRAAHQAGCRNFIFVSSAAVYAESEAKIIESHSTDPKSIYGETKLSFENYLRNQNLFSDSNVRIVRPFNIVGRNSQGLVSNSVVTKLIDSILKGRDFEFRTGPNQESPIRDYIDVQDVARLIVMLIKYQEIGVRIVNACTGVGVNLSALIQKCEVALSKTLTLTKVNLSDSEILKSTGDPTFASSRMKWSPQITLEKSIRNEIASK